MERHGLRRDRAGRQAAGLHQVGEQLTVVHRRTASRSVAGASSLRKMSKQCAQWVTSRWNRTPPSVPATRPAASRNAASSPIRRAGSPVQVSAAPRIAKSTPAARRSWAVARAMRRPCGSNAPAQPTQYSTSVVSPGRSSRTPRSAAHARRSAGTPRTGFRLHGGLESPGRRGVNGARLDEGAPEVDQLVQDLNLEGARADACRARRAGPGLLGAQQVFERAALAHRLEGRLNHAPGIERLAGRRRGTYRRAPAAADAGSRVEQLSPGEALSRGRSGFLGVGGELAGGPQLAQGELHRRGDHVAEDGRPDQAEEDPAERRVEAPERAVKRHGRRAGPPRRANGAGQAPTDEGPGLERRVGRRDAGRLQEKAGHSDGAEERQDPERDAASLEPGAWRASRRQASQPTPARKASPAHSSRNEKMR